MASYYEILGVESTADLEEIRRRHRYLCRVFHPDLNPDVAEGDGDHLQHFKQIQEAYDVLCDTEKRAAYDTKLQREQRKAEREQREAERKRKPKRRPPPPRPVPPPVSTDLDAAVEFEQTHARWHGASHWDQNVSQSMSTAKRKAKEQEWIMVAIFLALIVVIVACITVVVVIRDQLNGSQDEQQMDVHDGYSKLESNPCLFTEPCRRTQWTLNRVVFELSNLNDHPRLSILMDCLNGVAVGECFGVVDHACEGICELPS